MYESELLNYLNLSQIKRHITWLNVNTGLLYFELYSYLYYQDLRN